MHLQSVSEKRRFRWRGAVGVILLTPIALISLLSPPIVREDGWLDLLLDGLGWVLFLGGAVLRFWATLYVGGRKDDVLVTDGPYSLCRNPLYVGSLLVVLGGGLFLKSLIFAGAVFVLILVYSYATISVEEQLLFARFGPDYTGYCDRVHRFVPRVRGFRTTAHLNISVHSLRLESARASRWMWIPFLGEALAHLRMHAWWPQIFKLF